MRLNMLNSFDASRMSALVRRVGRLPRIDDIDARRVLKLLPQDKKSIGGRIQWVIPVRIGRVKIVADVPPRMAAAAFHDVQHGMASRESTA
jgi:3-dehydroquinate synthetase